LLDALRWRSPRFVPEEVVTEYARLLASYNIISLTGDRWGGGFHTDAWRRNGISYVACEQTTSENYLAALPLLLSGRARLLDEPTLQRELTGLERRAHANGRESVSHATAASAHDDAAAAACGALIAAGASDYAYNVNMDWVYGDGDPQISRPLSWSERQEYARMQLHAHIFAGRPPWSYF
jgi:hypothetical protein